MPFADLAAFIAPGFDLPIRGKTYHIPEPPAKDGLYLQAIVDTSESLFVSQAITAAQRRRNNVVTPANERIILDDDQERTVYQMALGTAYDEMVTDDVPWSALKHAGMTAVMYWTRSAEVAEKFWAGYGPGKASQTEKTRKKGSRTSSATSPTDPSTPSPA